jgi:hypothetical protein
VLERQSEPVRRLLLRTSLLDRVGGDLADLLTGGSGGERILHDLERANAFVVSLDARLPSTTQRRNAHHRSRSRNAHRGHLRPRGRGYSADAIGVAQLVSGEPKRSAKFVGQATVGL